MATILNKSVNETLSRTLLTSLTTLVVVIALFVLGGGIIHDFSFALLVGVLVGTFSSVYVASPILLAWQARRK
jgi:preprotein translocase subunit SecF